MLVSGFFSKPLRKLVFSFVFLGHISFCFLSHNVHFLGLYAKPDIKPSKALGSENRTC